MTRTITIRGGMFQTGSAGNGIWVPHDEVAALSGTDLPEVPYVADHAMGIDSVAGFVKSTEAERFDIEVPILFGEDAGKTRKERATLLKHESVLTEDYPAFESVARSFQAHHNSGRTPQESVAFSAKRLEYEEDTDRLFLAGIGLVHHSHVSKGAHGPEDGVGAFELVFGEMEVEARDASGTLISHYNAPATALLTNPEELVASFSAAHADNPAALRAAARAGLIEDKDTAPASPESPAEPAVGVIGDGSNRSASMNSTGMVSTMTEHTDPAAPAEPTPENRDGGAGAGDPNASVLDAIRGFKADFDSRLSALEQAREEDTKAAIDAAKEDAIARGLDEAIVDECTSVAEVGRLLKVFALRSNAPPTRSPDGSEDEPEDESEPTYDSDDVKGWAASMAERNPALGKVAPGVDA